MLKNTKLPNGWSKLRLLSVPEVLTNLYIANYYINLVLFLDIQYDYKSLKMPWLKVDIKLILDCSRSILGGGGVEFNII